MYDVNNLEHFYALKKMFSGLEEKMNFSETNSFFDKFQTINPFTVR